MTAVESLAKVSNAGPKTAQLFPALSATSRRRKGLGQSFKVLLRYPRTVGHIDDGHEGDGNAPTSPRFLYTRDGATSRSAVGTPVLVGRMFASRGGFPAMLYNLTG